MGTFHKLCLVCLCQGRTHRDVLSEEANLREHLFGVHVKVGVAHVELEEGATVRVLGVLAAAGDADGCLRVAQRQAVLRDLPIQVLA